MPELVVENLSKSFGTNVALDHVDFTVKDGEFFTLLGPSGCGKSTTLSSIAGLEQPDTGTIRVGPETFVDCARGRFMPPEERNLGMVFQTYALWPHMSVTDNLAMPLKLRKVPKSRQREQIHEVLHQVGLEEHKDRYPHQLSGGQQQRVALARALVYSPTVLLLDEPLSNLDAKLRDQARVWLKHLQREVGVTTVYVTHDQLEALALSDRIAVMGEGSMLQVGDPRQIYEAPSSPEVARFMGRCNFLAARVQEHGPDPEEMTVRLEPGGQLLRVLSHSRCDTGAPITVAVRSERLRLLEDAKPDVSDEGNAFDARVLERSYVGARFEYQLEAEGFTILAESPTELATRDVRVHVPPDSCVIFDREDERTVAEAEVT